MVDFRKAFRADKRDIYLTAAFLLICTGLVFLPTGFEHMHPEKSHFARGQILEVDNSDIKTHMIVKSGVQELKIEILNGPYKGRVVTSQNPLRAKLEIDEIYKVGHTVLLEFGLKDGTIKPVYCRGIYRVRTAFLLLCMFSALLMLVGGWTGLKALLSFAFAALMLWKVMVPCFLKGYDPVWVALGVVAALTAAISFMVGGLNRKGLVTFMGAFLGLLLTCLLAVIFTNNFQVNGAVRPFAETLLYSGFYNLNLTKIFIAGIFVACSGAVMDLAMDIAASMYEVIEKHPDISMIEHIESGMAVGRSVIGTMTTTLLLAYSGSCTTMMMLFMAQGVPLRSILNLNFVAAEVLNTLVGSFGLITVAPFTALVGGLVYGKPLRKRPGMRS